MVKAVLSVAALTVAAWFAAPWVAMWWHGTLDQQTWRANQHEEHP